MSVWPDAKRINKACESCGEMMEEVPVKRKICTKCRRAKERAARKRS